MDAIYPEDDLPEQWLAFKQANADLAAEHDGYGFDRHAGYGTHMHRLALVELGPCRVHRLSYAGVGA